MQKTIKTKWQHAIALIAIGIFSTILSTNAKGFSVLLDSHIGFEVKKFGLMNVKGHFKEFSGELSLDENGQISALKGEVATHSVFSDSAKRDKHLLESDFLDASAFPKMNLQMIRYTAQSQDDKTTKGTIIAKLQIRDKTKEVEFESLLSQDNEISLELRGVINIKDFGIDGSMMNSNTVRIILQTRWSEK